MSSTGHIQGSTTGRWTRPVAVAVAVLALALLDGYLGWRVFYVSAPVPALVANTGAVIGLVVARRHLLLGVGVAAFVSTAVSVVCAVFRFAGGAPFVGGNAPPGVSEVAILGVLVAQCIRQSRTRVAAAATVMFACALVALVELRMISLDSPRLNLGAIIVFIVFVGAGLYLRTVDGDRRSATVQARLDERAEMARDLHDITAHHLTAVVIQTQAAQLLREPLSASVLAALAGIERSGSEALAAMRAIVRDLRDVADTPYAPTSPYEELLSLGRTAHDDEAPVRLVVDRSVETLPSTMQLSIQRIVREAIINARTHSTRVSEILVHVRHLGDHVEVDIDNDGTALHGREGTGFGIIGMVERAKSSGGSLTAGARPAGGWRVHAMLPIADGSTGDPLR